MALACAPSSSADSVPGFYLLDDADGRFVVDDAFGFISLRDEAALEAERDHIYPVRLRVVELSGETYTLDMRLQITGIVPQMLEADDDPPPHAHNEASADHRLTPVAWQAYSATQAHQAAPSACGEDAAFGALLPLALPEANADVSSLALAEPIPAPSCRDAHWTL